MARKKVDKYAKMTEEEKVIFLEQQKQAEEELSRKREDLLTEFLKEKLEKEINASRFNLNKLNHQWRNIMRDLKSKDLKKEIEILSQTFERVVDRKDNIIKSIMETINEADQQTYTALASHNDNVNLLNDIHNQRLKDVNIEMDDQKMQIICQFENEMKSLKQQYAHDVNNLQDIQFAMEQSFSNKMGVDKKDIVNKRSDIKTKDLEDKQALKVSREVEVNDLWSQFTQAMDEYNESTVERRKNFESLKAKDENSAIEMEAQVLKLQQISENIQRLKAKMMLNTKEGESQNRNIKEKREAMTKQFHLLKNQMNLMRKNAYSDLKDFVLRSNDVTEFLKDILKKGEKIIKSVEICRKLETEEEKVLPFYISTLNDEETIELENIVKEKPEYDVSSLMKDYKDMDNFWRRYNRVLLEKVALEKEKSVKLNENNNLRSLLKQYLDGISVNSEILSKENPLLVINNKSKN